MYALLDYFRRMYYAWKIAKWVNSLSPEEIQAEKRKNGWRW